MSPERTVWLHDDVFSSPGSGSTVVVEVLVRDTGFPVFPVGNYSPPGHTG